MSDESTEPSETRRDGKVNINLTSFGLQKSVYPCRVIFDTIGRPDQLEVDLPNNMTLFNSLVNEPEQFRDQKVYVTLGDGTAIDATLAIAGTPSGNLLGSTITAPLHIGHSTTRQHPSAPADRWRILFVNAHLDGYDYGIRTTTERGWSLNQNEIRFRVAARDWVFVDDLAARWRSPQKPDKTKPVAGVRLETACINGDTLDGIQQLATDVEALLRLALGRSVSWYSVQRLADDVVVERYDAPKWIAPYSNQSQIISNIRCGTLKGFLEKSYDVFAVDRDWFNHTILQFIVSLSASHLEIRMSLQNTLLDRISSHILRKDINYEIDHELPNRLTKEFRKQLHALFQKLSPQWSQERTADITRTIKDWNSGPSFPGAVERAAVRLGLWPPAKSQIRKRHKLIHEGEYDGSDGATVFDYWKHIECLVVMLILRLLGYSGQFYHLALGPMDLEMAALMIGGTQRPPYSIEAQNTASLQRLVEIAAYLHWCGRNRPNGDPLTDWVLAEGAIAAIAPMRRNAQ